MKIIESFYLQQLVTVIRHLEYLTINIYFSIIYVSICYCLRIFWLKAPVYWWKNLIQHFSPGMWVDVSKFWEDSPANFQWRDKILVNNSMDRLDSMPLVFNKIINKVIKIFKIANRKWWSPFKWKVFFFASTPTATPHYNYNSSFIFYLCTCFQGFLLFFTLMIIYYLISSCFSFASFSSFSCLHPPT